MFVAMLENLLDGKVRGQQQQQCREQCRGQQQQEAAAMAAGAVFAPVLDGLANKGANVTTTRSSCGS
jgi:hypothetical protein